MKINLNHEKYVKLGNFACGKTQNIELKIGRKTYMLDIDKNACSARLDFYNKKNSDRNNYSKYGNADLHSVTVLNNAWLDKEFFANIAEIESAIATTNRFSRYFK